ncbi:MAG: CocE/NonD family hydrolase [Bacteroidota bacterium]
MKKFVIISLPIFLVGVIIYSLISWALSERVLIPESSYEKTINSINENWGKPYDYWLGLLPEAVPFTVETFDGLELRGNYFALSDSSTCAIIFAHGWGSTWPGMIKYVPAFENCNCDYVFYDHRVHGESGGQYATGGIYEANDLLAVTDWVNAQKGFSDGQIGWMGSSWGAATSIMAGVDRRSVAFIIADAPFQDWYSAVFERGVREYGAGVKLLSLGVIQAVELRSGIDFQEASAVEIINQVDEPILLLHSKADSATASTQSVNLAANMKQQNSEFHHLDFGNDHVKDVLNNTEEWRNLVEGFLRKQAPQVLKAVPEE